METESEKKIAVCPACQSRYKVPVSMEGKNVSCKKCGKKFALLFEETAPLEASEQADPIREEHPSIFSADAQLAFGKLALKSELITKKQLIDAFIIQKDHREAGRDIHLGEILVGKKMISREQMESLLSDQQYNETRALDLRFGEIAVQMGFAGQPAVDTAMEVQERLFETTKSVAQLGDILIGDGIITDEQRAMILSAQNRPDRPPPTEPAKPEVRETAEPRMPSQTVSFELKVSEDKLGVFARPVNGEASGIALEAVKERLRELGIKHNTLSDEQIMENLKAEQPQGHGWMVAHATPAKPGRDEEIKLCFATEPLKVGTEKEGGVIDYKDRGAIPYVKQGELVAEKIPGMEGEPGTDLYGEAIPAAKFNKVKFMAGRGIEKSGDNLKFFSKLDGRPSLSLDGRIGVRPELSVSGDIGYDTGHVDFEGHIDVSGTVQDGFRVKARGLRASEILKADVEVSGDIVVDGGIIGANIRTKGNLTAKYARNAKIEALGNVVIRKEIYDCDIRTSSACIVENGKIISSRIAAKKGVQSVDIGSVGSNPCKLIVGIDEVTGKEIELIREKIAKWEEHKKGLETVVDRIQSEFVRLDTQIGKLTRAMEEATKQVEALEKGIEELRSQDRASQMTKLQEASETLKSRIHQFKRALEGSAEEKNQLSDKMAIHEEEIRRSDEELQRLQDRKDSITEWSKSQPSLPAVTVSGTIYAQNVIDGPNSAVKLKNDERRVVIKETLVDQDEDAPKRWHFGITLLD